MEGFGAYRANDNETPKLVVGPYTIVYSRGSADGDIYWIEKDGGEGLETTETQLQSALEVGRDSFPSVLQSIKLEKLERFFENEF